MFQAAKGKIQLDWMCRVMQKASLPTLSSTAIQYVADIQLASYSMWVTVSVAAFHAHIVMSCAGCMHLLRGSLLVICKCPQHENRVLHKPSLLTI